MHFQETIFFVQFTCARVLVRPLMLHSEFIPAQETDSGKLLIALHGLGDSIEGYRWMPTELALPALNVLLVNAPDPYYGGDSWYDFAGNPGPGVERSRNLLFECLDHQIEQGFKHENIVLFGFSQGCLVTLDTGLRYAKPLAGLIGVSGYVFEPEKLVKEWNESAKTIPVLMTHGTFDPMIPIDPVRQQAFLLRKHGLNLQWEEFQKEHTIAGREELDLIKGFIEKCLFAV